MPQATLECQIGSGWSVERVRHRLLCLKLFPPLPQFLPSPVHLEWDECRHHRLGLYRGYRRRFWLDAHRIIHCGKRYRDYRSLSLRNNRADGRRDGYELPRHERHQYV